ncbi:MAG: tRNA adenosine(34) deaminase TadA [Oscillospiraceae bacterium]
MAHRDFMAQALSLAEKAYALGEVPVGAVIVYKDTVIAQGYNCRETQNNALCHAEIVAIDAACKALGSWRLKDCTLYVTLEPCIMCTGAIINSRIKRVVFASIDFKAGGMGGLCQLTTLPLNHRPDVIMGVMEEECSEVLQRFFRELRAKDKGED